MKAVSSLPRYNTRIVHIIKREIEFIIKKMLQILKNMTFYVLCILNINITHIAAFTAAKL